jgi:hypothetical protein
MANTSLHNINGIIFITEGKIVLLSGKELNFKEIKVIFIL